MYLSTARIEYRIEKSGHWVTAWMDPEILNYYFTLIPKYYRVKKSGWKAHATVIRPEDNPVIGNDWGKYEGEIVHLIYDPYLWVDDERGIWWINLWCQKMDQIRVESNCTITSRITKPPWPGYSKCFHCTIATGSLI